MPGGDVVHDDVQPAVPVVGFPQYTCHRLKVVDVGAGDGEAALEPRGVGRLAGRGGVLPVGGVDVGAGHGELAGDRQPDAASSPGHDSDPPVQADRPAVGAHESGPPSAMRRNMSESTSTRWAKSRTCAWNSALVATARND